MRFLARLCRMVSFFFVSLLGVFLYDFFHFDVHNGPLPALNGTHCCLVSQTPFLILFPLFFL